MLLYVWSTAESIKLMILKFGTYIFSGATRVQILILGGA